MSIFDCDPTWPLCLYDFSHKGACPKFVTMRVLQPLHSFLIDDYFFSKDPELEKDQLRTVYIGHEERAQPPELGFNELVIQRDAHVCNSWKNPNFVPFFKKRFQAQDKAMFLNENLQFDIDDLLDAKQKLHRFVTSVT